MKIESNNRIKVQVVFQSSGELLRQIYTGFGLLERKGLINLSIKKASNFEPGAHSNPRAHAIINDKVRLIYDTHDDGSNFDLKGLDSTDFYFKRSYDESFVNQFKYSEKILPLGFNYAVYGPNDKGFHGFYWSLISSRTLKSVFESLLVGVYSSNYFSHLLGLNCGRHVDTIENLEDLPRFDLPPRVLSLTRLRNPTRVKSGKRREEENVMNEMRVGIIRKLRKELGKNFIGGVEPTEFAIQNYPDCVVSPNITKKSSYLKILKDSSICVASTGIRGSNGWRLGEFVANSKAIVSEKLRYSVPGNFSKNSNYLEFTTPDECVDSVVTLFTDPFLRKNQMGNNYLYYQNYLKPDMLIWNSIMTSLLKSEVE